MRRRRPRSSGVLVFLSLLLAAGATLVLRGHLARLEARAAAAGPGDPAVVATSALTRGTALDPAMLGLDRVPAAYRPPGALRSVAEASGHTLAADVAAGEVLTRTRLAPEGGPVAALVPEGLRAFPVTVAIPAGTVAPGDRVDVLATFGTGSPHTETVIEAAEVLMAWRGGGPEELGAEATTVILLVTPEDAERLAYARAFADLSLAVAPPEEGAA